jgi:hypothetical protein
MAWVEFNLKPEEYKETMIIAAWNDNLIVGPHFEITSCADVGQGGVLRPIIFYMNTERPQKHIPLLTINPDGIVVQGTVEARDFIKSA